MGGPADYRIEILPWPAGQSAGSLEAVEVTERTTLEDLGSINRAVERDFLSFRTGDITLGLVNDDGFFDDLFAHFGATDRWQLRMLRRGRIIFLGIVLGQGSVTFDRLQKMVEITAYGATKVLDETSAETVKRAVADMTVTTATSGSSTLTINSTAGLLERDVLHLTDHVNKEDVTIKLVTSGTQVTLTAALSNTYASGSPVVLNTPYYRYKSVDFLVGELFKAAGVPIAELKVGGSLFARLAPTPIVHHGLLSTKSLVSGGAERNGRVYAILKDSGSYYQPIGQPDVDWALEDATERPWIDWSKYRKQNEGPPTILLRHPDTNQMHDNLAVDDRGSTKKIYRCNGSLNGIVHLEFRDSTDGTTWTPGIWTDVATFNTGWGADTVVPMCCAFDSVRNQVYMSAVNATTGQAVSLLYDVGGATFTTLKSVTANIPWYNGMCYVPELDYVLALLCTDNNNSTEFTKTIVALRNGTEVYNRPFPGSARGTFPTGMDPGFGRGGPFATANARWVNGVVYMTTVSDGSIQLLYSNDDFVTVRMGAIVSGQIEALALGSRINGAYYFWANSGTGTADKHYHIATPFFAGVVGYADFSGKSVAEALQELAIPVIATFWVDDDFQGHFVARDQVPAGDVPDLTERDLLTEQSEVQLWDEARQHVKVSGGGFEVTAGDPNFSAGGLSVSSPLIPNQAYAQGLADNYHDFQSKRRGMLSCTVILEEDLRLHPMYRVIVDGRRWYVQESDEDHPSDEAPAKLVEDLENQPVA